MASSRREFIKQSAAIGVTVGVGGYVAGMGHARDADVPPPLRPPGSLRETDFVATCIRCMRCVDACPNHALTPPQPPGVRSGSGVRA